MQSRCTLRILIPSSLAVETADKRIKTYKVGQIARTASIFNVDQIMIYRDPEHDDSRFMETVLRYVETPQYLRKKLFPLMEELRYAGVIPPLRTAHHPLNAKSSELETGEIREGVIEIGSDQSAWVDIGVECPALLRNPPEEMCSSERVTVRISSKSPLEVELADKKDIPQHWGYDTRVMPSLGSALDACSSMIVFTSRHGESLDAERINALHDAGDVAFVFGSPKKGVEELLGDEGLSTEGFSRMVLNTIPSQGTETVRTEEAVIATLAIYNHICRT